jgi:AAA15 family ATPase/GTPase
MVFPLVVNACVLNQSHGHWLLTNAFHFVITMNTKLMDEDLGMVNELTLLASNIKKVLYCSSFYFILKKYERKTHTCCP